MKALIFFLLIWCAAAVIVGFSLGLWLKKNSNERPE
jgi:hypothetical protein